MKNLLICISILGFLILTLKFTGITFPDQFDRVVVNYECWCEDDVSTGEGPQYVLLSDEAVDDLHDLQSDLQTSYMS